MEQLEYLFSDDYMVLRPDKCGILGLLHLLLSAKLWENRAVDCLWGTEERDRGRRWAMFVSLLLQMILLRVGWLVTMVGSIVVWIINMLYLNGGLLTIAINLLRGRFVIPNKVSPYYRSMTGLIDTRVKLDKRFRNNNSIQYHAELSIMAAKLAYENEPFIRSIVIEHWQMEFLGFFNCWNDFANKHSAQAFLFSDKLASTELIVVAFSGTMPFDTIQWCTNIDLSWYDIPHLGKVHAGFAKVLGQQKNIGFPKIIEQHTVNKHYAYYTIREKLRDLLKKKNKGRFLVTGHSSGGALAILFATFLAYHEEDFLLDRLEGIYTYGQPLVGDEKLGEYVERKLNEHKRKYFRFVYSNDIVPRLPYDKCVPMFKHFGVYANLNSVYKLQVYHEQQHENYFSPSHAIIMYLNSSFELLRSCLATILWGENYREGHILLLMRGLACVFPWLPFHSVQDYVNAVRLGVCRQEANTDVKEQVKVKVLTTVMDDDSEGNTPSSLLCSGSTRLSVFHEEQGECSISRDKEECSDNIIEEALSRHNGEVEESNSEHEHDSSCDNPALSLLEKTDERLGNNNKWIDSASTMTSVVSIAEDDKTDNIMLNGQIAEDHTLVISIEEVGECEQENRISSFSFLSIQEVDTSGISTEILNTPLCSKDESDLRDNIDNDTNSLKSTTLSVDEESETKSKEADGDMNEDENLQQTADMYSQYPSHRWSWTQYVVETFPLSNDDGDDIERILEEMSRYPVAYTEEPGIQIEDVTVDDELGVDTDSHIEYQDPDEDTEDFTSLQEAGRNRIPIVNYSDLSKNEKDYVSRERYSTDGVTSPSSLLNEDESVNESMTVKGGSTLQVPVSLCDDGRDPNDGSGSEEEGRDRSGEVRFVNSLSDVDDCEQNYSQEIANSGNQGVSLSSNIVDAVAAVPVLDLNFQVDELASIVPGDTQIQVEQDKLGHCENVKIPSSQPNERRHNIEAAPGTDDGALISSFKTLNEKDAKIVKSEPDINKNHPNEDPFHEIVHLPAPFVGVRHRSHKEKPAGSPTGDFIFFM